MTTKTTTKTTTLTLDLSIISGDCAETIAQALLDDYEHALAFDVVRFHGESAVMADDGNAEVEMTSESLSEAAQEYVDDGDWEDGSKTSWVTVYAWRRWTLGDVEIDEERESHTVEIPPEEPECDGEHEHDWCSPIEVVGGIRENPGCWGHGGGVVYNEVCRHCGCLRETDTWAQNPETGEQGLTSVSYDPTPSDSWNKWARGDD